MGIETLETVMRKYAEAIEHVIQDDVMLSEYDGLTTIVEDKAEIENTIQKAIATGTGGIAVLISVTGFTRRRGSGEMLTGTLRFQVSCHENPLFNRKGQAFVMTAQCVAERIAAIMHWKHIDGFDNRILVDDVVRADDNKANVVVVSMSTEQSLTGV